MGIVANSRGAARPRGTPAADDPILISKITVPALPGWVVARPRLERLIADGARGPLTVVTGPPGAGKTMATALWAAGASAGTTVWITLDRYDNRPKAFWSYVVAALQRAGITVPRVLSAPTRAAVDHAFLLRLASVLADQDAPVTLVLDDLHLVTEPAILDGLDYVLRNATARLHLVVSSRMDPLLPLHRYRLTGELAEIRADDLAFSPPESASLLAHHGITLPAAALQCLTQRTEGWAAGVRMAALSLDGHPDPEQFVKELDADDSAVTGYLLDEVLNAQRPATRELLLRTSILDCVSADLASELADDAQAASTLAELAQANAFVRPLGHGWFRYHAMFAEVLRLKLRSERPDQLPDLHQRAAWWYQRNGYLLEAVRHAAACGNWPLAAGMVIDELAIGQFIDPRGSQSLAEVFRDMPLDLGRTHPYPLLVIAAMELSDGAAQPCATTLAAAESVLGDLPADRKVQARLSATLIRLALSRRTGDLDTATAAAADATALLGELPENLLARHPGIRAQVLSGRGAAELRAGRLEEAVATFKEGAAASAPDSTGVRADCLAHLALLEALGGRLSRAAELAGAAVQTTQDGGDGLTEHVAPAASIALAWVHLDRHEIPQMHSQLRLAEAALRLDPDKLISAVARLIAAWRRLAEGRALAASDIIGHARQDWSPPGWLDRRLTLLESRVATATGDIQAAVAAARRSDPASGPDAAAALARAWLAAGDQEAARQALEVRAEGAGPAPEQARLEGWLVDAQLCYVAGDGVRGRRSLEHALRLGRPQQLRLPFVLERTWVQPVLRREPDLVLAYGELLEPDLASSVPARVPVQPGSGDHAAPLIVEPLTEREREALQHLSEMLSTAEIAAEMYISVNTVKSHLRSIYRKLSAAHRNEAVRRARQLELI